MMNFIPGLFGLTTLVLAVSSLVSAAAPKPDHDSEVLQIQRRLDQILDAAVKKDFARLDSYHLYGPKFTKFTAESPVRLNAAAARQGEHDGLSAIQDLAMRIEDLKIDVFEQVGVATFTLNSRFRLGEKAVQSKAHGTLVLVKDHGEWKITHEHFSAAKDG